MRYTFSFILLLLLACVAVAQCWTMPAVIYHQPYYHPVPAPVLIDSRVIETPPAAPATSQVEQPKIAEVPKPTQHPEEGCRIEHTEEDQDGPTVLNYGVKLGKLGSTPRYRLNGVEVTRDQAIAAVEGAEIPDDAGLLRLTVIGSKEDRAQVLEDLDKHPALIHLKGKLLVQAYDATDPRVSKRGFVCTGKPTIYLSAPDGQVLARNLDGEYRGPEALAYAIGAAGGKPYEPEKDKPMPVKPEPSPLAVPKSLADVPAWAWVAGVVALFLFFRKGGAQ